MDWIKEVVVMMLVDGVTIISFLALFAGIILWRGLGSFLGRIDGRCPSIWAAALQVYCEQ